VLPTYRKSSKYFFELDLFVSATNNNEDTKDFPPVPKEAIVKPEDERPVKMVIKPEETLEEKQADTTEYPAAETEDMDGDGSPDWDPAVGPGV
jgi:hypothetical protein